MNDFDYENNVEKRRQAKMNQYKVNRVRSRKGKCVLPSDNLTSAQIKKRNGETKMYRVGEPITWQEFKKYPPEMQQEWVNRFVERFNCSTKGMGLVFGVQGGSINTYLKKRGVEINCSSTYNEQKGQAIREWMGEVKAPVVEEEKSKPKPEPKKPEKPEMPYFVNTLRKGSITLSGNSAEIFQTMFGIFRDARLSVTVHFSVIPDSKQPNEVEVNDNEKMA